MSLQEGNFNDNIEEINEWIDGLTDNGLHEAKDKINKALDEKRAELEKAGDVECCKMCGAPYNENEQRYTLSDNKGSICSGCRTELLQD